MSTNGNGHDPALDVDEPATPLGDIPVRVLQEDASIKLEVTADRVDELILDSRKNEERWRLLTEWCEQATARFDAAEERDKNIHDGIDKLLAHAGLK